MLVFLDFEASSLSKHSYPVEVAWIFEDGRARTHLIRPTPDWNDWSAEAERIHGLSRRQLQTNGTAVDVIAGEMLQALSGHQLFASSPSWDGKWLSVLLRAGGLPRHSLRLRKSDDAFYEAAADILGPSVPPDEITRLIEEVIADSEPQSPAHRALPDATLELERLGLVKQAAVKARSKA